MSLLHSYPWYSSDWLQSRTRVRMTLAERALYRDALDLCYQDGSIPSDERSLCLLLACTPEEFHASWPAVRQALVELPNGDLTHPRVQQDLPGLLKLTTLRKRSASTAARARWDRERIKLAQSAGIEVDATPTPESVPEAMPDASAPQCEPDACGMRDACVTQCPTQCENDASECGPAAVTNTTTPLPPTPSPEGDFSTAPRPAPVRRDKRSSEHLAKALGPRLAWWEEFWRVFPCHEGKRAGMEAFERRVTTPEQWEAVRAGAERYAAKARARPDMPLKYPQGWINDERWNDEDSLVTALPRIVPDNTGVLTFAERNAAIRNEIFRQSTMEKLRT